MDAAAELGRNPVSKHQIQPEYGDEQADAGRDGWTHLARPNSQARTGTGEYYFPCSADHEQDWQPYPVDLYSANICDDHTYIHHNTGSSTIELPSAFAESGAYPPDRALPGSPRHFSLPLACHHIFRRAPNWSSEEARTWEHHRQPTIPPPRLNRQAEPQGQPVGCISRGSAQRYARRKDHPTLIPRNQVSEGEGEGC